MHTPRWAQVLAVLAPLTFLLMGGLWIDYPGLQYDETLFVHGTYSDPFRAGIWHTGVLGDPVCVLIMPYLGALKGWLYMAVLAVAPASAASLRFPVLVLGALTLWLTYCFTRRAFSWRIALGATWLAASDPLFVLTTRLDWGPVVIQRLLLMLGCLLVFHWARQGLAWQLIIAFLVFGIGVFDKATFLFLMLGLALATVCVFPRELIKGLRNKWAVPAVLAFCIGSLPFWWYPTARAPEASSTFDFVNGTDGYLAKYIMLRASLEGTSVVTWLASEDLASENAGGENSGGEPDSARDSAVWLPLGAANGRQVQQTWTVPALGLALLLLPFSLQSRHGRGVVFSLLFCLVTLGAMFPVQSIGSVHHLVLIYPFPQIFLAAGVVAGLQWLGERFSTSGAGIGAAAKAATQAGTQAATRAAAGASAVFVVVLTLVNFHSLLQQYDVLLRYGGSTGWSEAIYELDDYLESEQPSHVVAVQWGVFTQLRFLSKDRLHVIEVPQPHGSPQDPLDKLEQWIPRPESLFVLFDEGQPNPFPEMRQVFYQSARRLGYEPRLKRAIADRQGRAMYEVFEVDAADPHESVAATGSTIE
jgi:4-amino-4-deoxy-L-arabinose transferase-like glycosyltransferase